MRRSSSCTLLALVVAAAFGATVDASARNFFTPGSNSIRARWTEWQVEIGEGGVVRCPLTLEATFHGRTFHKIVGVLVGYVRGSLNETACRSEGAAGTRARIQLLPGTPPWHLRYRSFSGTPPTPTAVGVDVLGPAVRVYELLFGMNCLYGAAEAPLAASFVLNASRQVTGLRNELALSLREGALCPARIVGAGSGTVTEQSSASLVTMTLI